MAVTLSTASRAIVRTARAGAWNRADGFTMGSAIRRERTRRGRALVVVIALITSGCSTGAVQSTGAVEAAPSSLPLLDEEGGFESEAPPPTDTVAPGAGG